MCFLIHPPSGSVVPLSYGAWDYFLLKDPQLENGRIGLESVPHCKVMMKITVFIS